MTGIIGAIDVEIQAIISAMEHTSEETVSGVRFVSGHYHGKRVVVARSGVGKVAAAMCAQTMVLRYGVTRIINTGVAGALSPGLDVGDVALATALVQHDMDTTAMGDPPGWLSGVEKIYLPCARDAIALIQAAPNLPPIHVGAIATGDCFVHQREHKARIAAQFGAIACEMEGGAIAQVCHQNGIPVTVIRSISDRADGDAVNDFSAFCRSAAANAVLVLEVLLQRLA